MYVDAGLCQSYALSQSCTPGLIVCIMGWTARVSVLLWVVFLLQLQLHRLYCNCAHGAVLYCAPMFVGYSALMLVDQAVPYCTPMFVGCCVLMQAQCMVLWLRILVWPWVDLGHYLHFLKSIGCIQTSWNSIKACMDTKANLCLNRISWDKNWSRNRRQKFIWTSVMLEDENLK